MDRREFLANSTFALSMAGKWSQGATVSTMGQAQSVRLNVDPERVLGVIPPDFMGLGYEISSVARLGLLSGRNRTYVQLVRALGAQGVIRVGGNTLDYSTFSPEGQAVSAPKTTVVNEAVIKDLGTFLDATGWKLIWGLNLGRGTPQQAVEEAQAVATTAKDKLLALEIGNEPDLFDRAPDRRATGMYSFTRSIGATGMRHGRSCPMFRLPGPMSPARPIGSPGLQPMKAGTSSCSRTTTTRKGPRRIRRARSRTC